MTETQATPGAAGASTTPDGSESAESPDGAAAGRAVVGRASVGSDGGGPKFTRAPGMAPPPESPNSPMDLPAQPGVHVDPVTPGAGSSGRASVPAGARLSLNSATASAGRASPVESPTAPISSGSARGRAAPGSAGSGGRVAEAVRNARAAVSSATSRGPRRARLFVKRIDPWSVMKFSFAVSFVLFFVAIVATAVLYLALDAMGVIDSVNKALADMIGATGGKNAGFKITALGVIGVSGVLGLVNVVLFTALATLSAFIYNVCADLVGGIEVTLSEKE